MEDELPMDKGWAEYAWAIENDPMNMLGGIKRASDGYIRQEVEKLMAQAKHLIPEANGQS